MMRKHLDSTGDGSEKFPPLESRMVEDKSGGGAVTKFPAVNKRFATSFPCVQFYLPSIEALRGSDSAACLEWMESMDIYRSDLLWLLKLPHHKFWSFLIYSRETAESLLSSFLLRAIRPHDLRFADYQKNDLIWQLFSEIYDLVFRVFVRICVYKESPSEHITPSKWASWVVDNNILSIAKILDLSALYDTEDKPDKMLAKMWENVFKNVSQIGEQLVRAVPLFVKKLEDPAQNFGDKIRQMIVTSVIDEQLLYDLLAFQIDSLASYYSLIKHYPPAAKLIHHFPQFELRLASAYESVVQLYGSAVNLLPESSLGEQLQQYRQVALQVFRSVLTESTIYSPDGEPKAEDIDAFLACLTSCVDEKTFTYDYTKVYSFPCDIADLSDRGIAIDDTRINYLTNAISECWRHFGDKCSELNSVCAQSEIAPLKLKHLDPLDDPDFDRQTLGACSLEVSGVELHSLVTNVKDLFQDLPTRYIEVCLKHYGYNSETVINAILEGSVPSHLEAYKVETPEESTVPPDQPVVDNAPEMFHKGKWSGGYATESEFLDGNKGELKSKILESLQSLSKISETSEQDKVQGYVDESFFPSFDVENDYDSEYDDTYDDVAVGSTEPETWLYNPLNAKADDVEAAKSSSEDEDSGKQNGTGQKKHFDYFVEDPAVVRERMERRRAEKMQHRKHNVPDRPRDVVGKAKGQGQDKEVVLNRRHKEVHANQNRRRGADRKRREF